MDIHYVDNDNFSKESLTVLQLAVIKKAPIDILGAMIQLKPIPQNKKTGWTALHTAARYNVPLSIVQFLLNECSTSGAWDDQFELVCATSTLGCTALHLAVSYKSPLSVVMLLISTFPGSVGNLIF